MSHTNLTRRGFLQSSTAWAGAAVFTQMVGRAVGFQTANERPRIGAVGTGSRWSQRATGVNGGYGSAQNFPRYGDIVAVCDADAERRERAKALVKKWSSGHEPDSFADYRKIIDRDDIDVVHISTPEHWHAKIAIEAMLSGKDVYCEKPMTLTIEEGRQMCNVCRKTKRIVQIGTQQRSGRKFMTAIALIRDGRLGKLNNVVEMLAEHRPAPSFRRSSRPRVSIGTCSRARHRTSSIAIWPAPKTKPRVGRVASTNSAGGMITLAES